MGVPPRKAESIPLEPPRPRAAAAAGVVRGLPPEAELRGLRMEETAFSSWSRQASTWSSCSVAAMLLSSHALAASADELPPLPRRTPRCAAEAWLVEMEAPPVIWREERRRVKEVARRCVAMTAWAVRSCRSLTMSTIAWFCRLACFLMERRQKRSAMRKTSRTAAHTATTTMMIWLLESESPPVSSGAMSL